MSDCLSLMFVFFFKQKTAYEMRISDWSSDVCSSDLPTLSVEANPDDLPEIIDRACRYQFPPGAARIQKRIQIENSGRVLPQDRMDARATIEIGRASCRESVCMYV